MQKYIVVLRGINVGGRKTIRMAELKQLFESLGFDHVLTYIQSGNVIFNASVKQSTVLTAQIENEIKRQYGFPVAALIRTVDEMKRIVSGNPFLERRKIDLSTLHIALLPAAPEGDKGDTAEGESDGKDTYILRGREIYLHCPGGYGRTRFSNTFLEKRFGLPVTTRNWNTVNRLIELAQGD